MAEEGVVDNADRIGTEVFGPGLAELAEKHAVIGEVRGVGVVLGHRTGHRPGHAGAAAGRGDRSLKKDLLGRGLLPFTADNRIHVVPPMQVSDEDARLGLALIDEALDRVPPDRPGRVRDSRASD